MTTISIITQISMYDIFGKPGCILFGLSIGIHEQLLVIGGFGMALFRIICVENLTKIDRAKLVKIIHLVEFIFVIGTTSMSTIGIKNAGWEKNSMNQFCKDYGLVKAKVYHSYLNYENQKFGK